MIKAIFIFLALISVITSRGQVTLSEKAQISVITIGPWQGELYSAFGHSAFRVYDPVSGINEAYDYGVFDFDQPNFYLNFARGFLYYKVAVRDYERFEYSNIYFNRYVHEQVLDLTPRQTQMIYDYLQWNIQPENEFYRYDYFYDNCATKLPEIILKVLGDSVHFDGSYINTDYTIRELTDLYLIHQPWGELGIDICLGLPMDKQATPYEYMFLPDFVESGFDHATVKRNGVAIPLVKKKNIIYESRPQEINGLPHPLYVFTIILIVIVVLSVFDIKRRKSSNWLDIFLFGVTGLVGILLLLLWTATDHQAAAKNFNLLWALPTHFIAAIGLALNAKWTKNYFLLTGILLIVLLLLWNFLPQSLNTSLIPFVVMLTVRAFTQFLYRKRSGDSAPWTQP